MSRIGKLPIHIPAGVTVTFQDGVVAVKGPKGSLSQSIDPSIKVSIENGVITLEENPDILQDNPKQRHAFHGLYRALVNNMVVGVSEGYKKEMEVVGVGYRVSNQGNLHQQPPSLSYNLQKHLQPCCLPRRDTGRGKHDAAWGCPEEHRGSPQVR